MKVWRAVGGQNFIEASKPTDSDYSDSGLYSIKARESGAVFVCPDELQALAWALSLEKSDIIEMEVSCIRDRQTLEVVSDFTKTSSWIQISGRYEIFAEMQLLEAVVLPSDIV